MPKKAERSMRRTAKKRGYGKARTARYVYGGLREIGWTPSHQKEKASKKRKAAKKK